MVVSYLCEVFCSRIFYRVSQVFVAFFVNDIYIPTLTSPPFYFTGVVRTDYILPTQFALLTPL